MLVLPIKKQWFDMILSGEKKEEYREIKPYYTKRFSKVGLLMEEIAGFGRDECNNVIINFKPSTTDRTCQILFRNGYSSESPSFVAKLSVTIGEGNPDWGAEPGIKYYVLHIKEITNTYKCKVGQVNKD